MTRTRKSIFFLLSSLYLTFATIQSKPLSKNNVTRRNIVTRVKEDVSPEEQLFKILERLIQLKKDHTKICDKIEIIDENLNELIQTTSVDVDLLIEKAETLLEDLIEHNNEVNEQFDITCTKIINIDDLLKDHIQTVSINTMQICASLENILENVDEDTIITLSKFQLICNKIINVDQTLQELDITLSIANIQTCSKLVWLNEELIEHNDTVEEEFMILCDKLIEINDTLNDVIETITTNQSSILPKVCNLEQAFEDHSTHVEQEFEHLCNKLNSLNQDAENIILTTSLNNENICAKLILLHQNLEQHNQDVADSFTILCEKIESTQEQVNEGFENTCTQLLEMELDLCEKFTNIVIPPAQAGPCDFIITQTHIDAGFVTPFDNTVYCLAESVTFTSDCAIIINKDNVVLNLQDRTIIGTTTLASIKIQDATNVQVLDGSLQNPNGMGITVNNSSFVKVSNICTLQTPRGAFFINASDNLLMKNLRMLSGNFVMQSSNNAIIKNCDTTSFDVIDPLFNAGFQFIDSQNIIMTKCQARDIQDSLNPINPIINSLDVYGFSCNNIKNITIHKSIIQNIDADNSVFGRFSAGVLCSNSSNIKIKQCKTHQILGTDGAKKENENHYQIRTSENINIEDCICLGESELYTMIESSTYININNTTFLEDNQGSSGIGINNCSHVNINNNKASLGITSLFLGLNNVQNSIAQNCRTQNTGGLGISSSSNITMKNNTINFASNGLGAAVGFAFDDDPDNSATGPSNNVQILNNYILGMEGPILGAVRTTNSANYQIFGNRVVATGFLVLGDGFLNTQPLANTRFANNVSVHSSAANYATGATTPPNVAASGAARFWENVS